MSGLLLTSDNIYGLVNPPPDPVDDLPESHQTIGSAGVRWDYFLDLSNNIGDHLIAGDNVTITGNVISVRTSTTSSSSTDNSGSTVNTSNVIVSKTQLTNVDLCNNRFIELTFNETVNHLETYDLINFEVKKYGNNVGLGEIYIKDGKVNLSLDYSANIVIDGSSTHLINPNDISGQLYFETFNDTKHIGNFQTQGTFEAGVNNIGYSKKGVSGEGLFNLTTSDIPNGVKAISFWVKDYDCLQETWFLVSDIVRLNGLAIELFVDNTNTLAGYGENLNKLYIDGNKHTLAARNSNLPFTLFDITPSLTPASFNGWHHVYIEAKTTFADIELLSRNGQNNSLGSLDEIRMYDRALTTIEISGLAIQPYLTTMDNLTEIEIKYTRDIGTKYNLKTTTNKEIQHFIYYNGTEYYIKDVLSYLKRVDLSLNQIVLDISDLSQNVNVRLDDLSGNINQTIYDLSQNINVRLEDLSKVMIENIVPVFSDISLNEGVIELNFTKDISNQPTYDISNFTIRYNDQQQNYNRLNIENGNVKLKYITEGGGGTAILTGPNSTLHSVQTYSASTQQLSTSSVANKAFDGQLTGQDSNTWKSNTELYEVSQSNSTLDISYQVFYENFDDQDYSGNQTTATIVSGGMDGIGYALEGTTNSPGKVWWHSTSDSFPNNVVAISFWHYTVPKISDNNGDIPYIWASNTNSSPGALSLGMDLLGSNVKYYTTNQKGFKITKWHLNGVDTVDISENSAGYDFNTQHRYVDVSLNRWYHHYFEFNNTFGPSTIDGIRWFGSTLNLSARYRGTGKLDEIRFFTQKLTPTQVIDISKGNNGNVTPDLFSQIYYESFDNEDVVFNSTNNIVYITGKNGGKAMSTIGQNPSDFQWQQNVSVSTKSISFFLKGGQGIFGDYHHIFDTRTSESASYLIYFDGNTNKNMNLFNGTGPTPIIYYNGVNQSYSNYDANVGSQIGNLTVSTFNNDNWHHFYIEFPTSISRITWFSRYNASFETEGAIDELRYFNESLNEFQIKHLSNGGNGDIGVLNYQISLEDFNNQNPIGTVNAGVSYVSDIDGNGKALSSIGLSNISPFIQNNINNPKAISFFLYGDSTSSNMNGKIIFDTRTNSGPNLALLFPNDEDYLHIWTGSSFSQVSNIYINGINQTINVSGYNSNFGAAIGNVYTKTLLSNNWTHFYISFDNTVTSLNDITWLSRFSSAQTFPAYLDDIRMFSEQLTQQQITDLSNNNIPSIDYTPLVVGSYKGIEITQGYSGEWIQVDMGSSTNTTVNSFTIKPQQNTNASIISSHPKEFKMFASNNTSSWNEISHITDLSNDTWYYNNGFSNYTVNISTPLQYQYWRLVVSKVINSNQVSIGELDFNGSIITNNASSFNNVNKLELAYRKNADRTKNLIGLIGGGEINDFIYKGLGLTNINKERFTDLSDVSVNNIIEGQFVKFDGTYFVPTNDISDISQNLANVNVQLTTLLTDAPATLDTLKEIADVLGDPTDASGGITTILNKLKDLSDDVQTLSTQTSGGIGDLSGQTTQAITDLSTIVFDRIHTSDTKLTFFEIMTRQPSAFSISGEVVASAGDIEINWTYDNILANSTNNILAKLAFQNTLKSKNIPFIDNITLEISGNINTGNSSYDNSSNSWITFTTGIWPKTFSNTEDYNTSSYKTLTINKTNQSQANSSGINNILSKTDPFDVRIYGTNYAENFPTINDRSLYFNDLSFVTALAPSTPQFASQNTVTDGTIKLTFNYYVTQTELNSPNSNGVLIDASNTYFDFETTSSSVSGSAITNSNIQTNTSISNIAKNINYPITISNLRAGTKYRLITAARNNLTSTTSYSASSSIITSTFTRLPSSTGSTPTSTWFNVSTYAYRISTPTGGSWSGDNLNNSSVRYLNKSNNDYLQLLNSNRTFEISLPYSSTQQNTEVGYGKFIDNSSNLTEISISVDGIEKQELVYGGFGINPLRINKNSNTVNYFSSPTTSDPYTNNKTKGFRLNGTFSVEDILHSNIGIPSSSGYSLNYTFNKHNDVGGNNISSTYKVYIDELTGNPTITVDGTETYVTALSYCMGIPSVETFDVSFNRTYNNVNSQYQYVRYHTSSPAGITVGLINSISKTNRSSTNYAGKINIDRTDIVTNGIYSFNSTEVDSKTSNRFRDIYFTQTIGTPTSGNQSPSDSISINEKSFNLNGDATINTSQTITYYCDYSSFNKSGSKITTPIVSITNMGEIANMSVFNTQLNSIAITNITSHENVINDWTLLFINGRFRSNASQPYPNVSGYTWTKPPGEGSFVTPLTYNSGSTSYYLNGSTTGSGNKYKWIAFKFTEANATTTTVSGIQYTYLNIYNLLSQNYYFTSTILGYLKNSSNNNVLGFIQQSYNSVSRIGNLSRGYSPSAIWYSQNAALSFNTIFEGADKSNYGCVFEENSTNWGPILDTTNGATDIIIYIGFNNDISL